MSDDDTAARKARAERLRKEIERLIGPGDKTASAGPPAEEPADESPREFIHKKMQEDADRLPPPTDRTRKPRR